MSAPIDQGSSSTTMSGQPSQAMMMEYLKSKGPPYPPRTATFGGNPHGSIDIGVSAMFIGIFACLAITHMTIFRRNKARGHFFVLSAVIFGFCMSRIATFSMRIASTKNPTNPQVAIAATVLISAGVILLYIINLIFAQRVLRGYHPRFGNSRVVGIAFKAYFVSVVAVLIMVIVASVKMFFTLDMSVLLKCRDIQRFGIIWFSIFSFLPIPLMLLSYLIPSSSGPQNFGKLGTLPQKLLIVLVAGCILTLENSIRAATAFLPQRPTTDPAWYHKRAAFYVFLPTMEVLVVVMYAVTRVDQRMWIPGEKERREEMEEREKQAEQEEVQTVVDKPETRSA